MAPPERLSERRAALKRQRALGSTDTKAAMKVLEKYCRKKYRQSAIFAGFGSQLHLPEDPSHSLSEPFTPRSAVLTGQRQFTFDQSTAFSCPETNKPPQPSHHSVAVTPAQQQYNQYAFDFGEHKLKEEMKYHKGSESISSYIWRVFKFLYDYLGIKHILLLLLMMLYALAGGYIFDALERPEEQRRDEAFASVSIQRHLNYTEDILRIVHSNCKFVSNTSWRSSVIGVPVGAGLMKCREEISDLLAKYDRAMRTAFDLDFVWKWDFWNAVFYSGTIFTTIGYGNISCKTMYGRMATCAYALCGIPLMLVVLNSLGKGLFLSVQAFWERVNKLLRRIGRKLRRTLPLNRQLTVESVDSVDLVGLTDDKEEDASDAAESDLFTTFPMSLALLTVFLYISLCSWLFCYWEDWDYATAFYFFFVSLSTVGLGDEMPKHPKRACAFFLFFIIGLALVSMCISILQVKVENKYMAALQLIDQEHEAAVVQADDEGRRQENYAGGDLLQSGGASENIFTPPNSSFAPGVHEFPVRPDRLSGMSAESVKWRRRQRLDSHGTFDSESSGGGRFDRNAYNSSQTGPMSSSAEESSPSPAIPPTVLGVFMARSLRGSERRRSSFFVRSDSLESRMQDRRHSMATSDDVLSPTSRSMAELAPSPTQSLSGSPQPNASPRAAASLAVITEGEDEESGASPSVHHASRPLLIAASQPQVHTVPEVRIVLAEEEGLDENSDENNETAEQRPNLKPFWHSSADC